MKKIKIIISCIIYGWLKGNKNIVPITIHGNKVKELFNVKTKRTIKLLSTIYI